MFKIGDKVKIIKDESDASPLIGKIGTVVGIFNKSSIYDYVVQFEGITSDKYYLHDGNDFSETFNFDPTKRDKRWYTAEQLELITNTIFTDTVGLTSVIDTYATTKLYADKMVCAVTSYDLKDISSKTKENYMELLNIYRQRQMVKLTNDCKDKEQAVLDKDPNYKVWKECYDKLATLFTKECPLYECDVRKPEITKESKDKLSELRDKNNHKMRNLEDLLHEVRAQLELCENRDDQMEVLRTYKIINEDGKINA